MKKKRKFTRTEALQRTIEIEAARAIRRRRTQEADPKQLWIKGKNIAGDALDALNKAMRHLQKLSSVDKALSATQGPQAVNQLMNLEGDAAQALGKANAALNRLVRYLQEEAGQF